MNSGKTHIPAIALCLGAQKAGTTTLHALMEQHPQVSTAIGKETGFFFEDNKFEKGISWYLETFFKSTNNNAFNFEADPNYLYYSKCIDRIHENLPKAKLIVVLRDPLKRAYSQWHYMRQRTHETRDFLQALKAENTVMQEEEFESSHKNYLGRSHYLRQIQYLNNIFSPTQIYYLKFETLVDHQTEEMNKLLSWLGLDPYTFKNVQANPATQARSKVVAGLLHSLVFKKFRSAIGKMLPFGMRKKLAHGLNEMNQSIIESNSNIPAEAYEIYLPEFQTEILELESLTGLDLRDWLKVP